MRRLGRIRLSIAAAALFVGNVLPGWASETIWDHNGSKIAWRSDGNSRSATYLEPRSGLASAGVRPGTVLFSGERRGSTLSGTAYVFKGGCSPAAYKVSTTITSEREFVLEGAAPVFEPGGCGIARYDTSNGNAALRFTFIPPIGDGVPAVAENPPVLFPPPAGGTQPADNDLTEVVTREVVLDDDASEPIRFNIELPSTYAPGASDGFVHIRRVNDSARLGWFSVNSLPEWMAAKKYCEDEANVSTGPGWARCSDKQKSASNISMYMEMPGQRLVSFYTDEPGEHSAMDKARARLIRSFIDNTNDLRRVALAERRQREDAEERDKERQRQAAAPPPDPNTITFKVRSNYRYKAQVEFYSQDRPHSWPGGGQVYNLDDSAIHTYRLSCRPGEKICYGAWAAGNSREYWGAGYGGKHGCTSCCGRCGGGVLGYNLDDAGGTASSFNANDLIDGLATGLGVAAGIAAAGGGGGRAAPVSPPRQAPPGRPSRHIESDVTRSR